MNNQEMIQKLSVIDKFSVEWAGRTERGDLRLASDVFRVTVTPAPLFGYNVRDFGFETANELQEKVDHITEHDFGACFIKPKSLRKLDDGKWYVDLSVDPHKCRYENVQKMVVQTDESGNTIFDEGGNPMPLLDSDGNVQVSIVKQKETFITCELSMLEPMTDHPLAHEYVQSDSRTRAKVNLAANSEKAKERSERKSSQKRGSRTRLSPAQISAVLGQQS